MKICGGQFVRHLPDWLKKKCQICESSKYKGRRARERAGAANKKREERQTHTKLPGAAGKVSLPVGRRRWIVTYFSGGLRGRIPGRALMYGTTRDCCSKIFYNILARTATLVSVYFPPLAHKSSFSHCACLGFSLKFIKGGRFERYEFDSYADSNKVNTCTTIMFNNRRTHIICIFNLESLKE